MTGTAVTGTAGSGTAGSGTAGSGTAVHSLGAEIAIAAAGAAARRGELDKAARILTDLDASGATGPAALDLLARVHAQRGAYPEADACWARVLDADPAYAGAASGRRALAEIPARGRRVGPPRRAGAIAAAVLLVVVAAGVAVGAGGAVPGGAAVAVDDTAARLERETRRADGLERQLAARDAERADSAADRGDRLDAIAAGVTMPGVVVQRGPDGVRVLFAEGVFAVSDTLTPEGRVLLQDLGRRLATLEVSTTVVGHVVAVRGGPSRGGSVVALARAQRAATVLSEAGATPLTGFELRSADQRAGPFPDDARNRTVSLHVAPPR